MTKLISRHTLAALALTTALGLALTLPTSTAQAGDVKTKTRTIERTVTKGGGKVVIDKKITNDKGKSVNIHRERNIDDPPVDKHKPIGILPPELSK